MDDGLVKALEALAEIVTGGVTFLKYGFGVIVLFLGVLTSLVVYIFKNHIKQSQHICKLNHRKNDAEIEAIFNTLDEIAPRTTRTIRVVSNNEDGD